MRAEPEIAVCVFAQQASGYAGAVQVDGNLDMCP